MARKLGEETPAQPATAEQKRAMRSAISGQCFGALAYLTFVNGLILLYLKALKISGEDILFLFSLYSLPQAVLLLPASWLADKKGKRKTGLCGLTLTAVAFTGLVLSGFAPKGWLFVLPAVFILLFAAGRTLFISGWFALMDPLVPEKMRGRFWGKLRVSWQVVGLIFGVGTFFFLKNDSSVGLFQIVLSVAVVGSILRVMFYARIPEVERSQPAGGSFWPAVVNVARVEGYAPFCAYVFLLTLFTAGCPALFNLLEKETLGFGDDLVAGMGILMMTGNLVGFGLGGLAVDRFGTKAVFVACHFSFGAVLLMFLLRGASPFDAAVTIGTLSLFFGLVRAASSIAVTTEMLSLIPAAGKSLSTGVCLTLLNFGAMLAALLSGWVLKLGLLNDSWRLFGLGLGAYDALLFGCAVMVVLLVVTLGLVPSVMRRKKAQWIPGGQ